MEASMLFYYVLLGFNYVVLVSCASQNATTPRSEAHLPLIDAQLNDKLVNVHRHLYLNAVEGLMGALAVREARRLRAPQRRSLTDCATRAAEDIVAKAVCLVRAFDAKPWEETLEGGDPYGGGERGNVGGLEGDLVTNNGILEEVAARRRLNAVIETDTKRSQIEKYLDGDFSRLALRNPNKDKMTYDSGKAAERQRLHVNHQLDAFSLQKLKSPYVFSRSDYQMAADSLIARRRGNAQAKISDVNYLQIADAHSPVTAKDPAPARQIQPLPKINRYLGAFDLPRPITQRYDLNPNRYIQNLFVPSNHRGLRARRSLQYSLKRLSKEGSYEPLDWSSAIEHQPQIEKSAQPSPINHVDSETPNSYSQKYGLEGTNKIKTSANEKIIGLQPAKFVFKYQKTNPPTSGLDLNITTTSQKVVTSSSVIKPLSAITNSTQLTSLQPIRPIVYYSVDSPKVSQSANNDQPPFAANIAKIMTNFVKFNSKRERSGKDFLDNYNKILSIRESQSQSLPQNRRYKVERSISSKGSDLFLDQLLHDPAESNLSPVSTSPKLDDTVLKGLAKLAQMAVEYNASSVSILSPRLLPLFPKNEAAASFLSPNFFSFFNNSKRNIAALPQLLSGLQPSDRDVWLEFLAEITGAAEQLDNAVKIIENGGIDKSTIESPKNAILDANLRMSQMWKGLLGSYTRQQRKDISRNGYTFMDRYQMELMYGTNGFFNYAQPDFDIDSYGKLSRRNKEEILRDAVRGIAGAPPDALRSWHRRQRQSILSPFVFKPAILGPGVLGPAVLSPSVFSPAVLSPGALNPAILSPSVGNPAILSPSVLSPAVLSPHALNPSVLSPGVLNPAVLNPSALSPSILSPGVLNPSVLSPSVLGGSVLSPSVLSPGILSPGVLNADVLSPSVLS